MFDYSQNSPSVENLKKPNGEIQFGKKQIRFAIQYTNRKSLGIQVHPTGEVKVIAPLTADYERIVSQVKTKAGWILKQQDFFLSFEPKNKPRLYINGETHRYLGRQYRLKIVEDPTKRVTALRGYLIVQTPSSSAQEAEKILDEWYRSRAEQVFGQLIEEARLLFARYHVQNPVLTIKRMEKRWGSCTAKGKITLNVELIKAPKNCIRYVIIHELCHLVNHSHNRAFYKLLTHIMPDWVKWKQTLEQTLA